jgi:ABC-type branched-subunit amino acid transport system ATPase component
MFQKEVLNVRGLSAGYGPMRVIHDLDLIVHSGERLGIVGLNGHGKSTLFSAIAGLTGWQRGSIKWQRDRPDAKSRAGSLHSPNCQSGLVAHTAGR